MATIEISSDEDALLDLLRGQTGADFGLTVSHLGDTWSVSITAEGEFYAGQGDTFRTAYLEAFGYAEKPKIRETLKVVGGIEHQAMKASA